MFCIEMAEREREKKVAKTWQRMKHTMLPVFQLDHIIKPYQVTLCGIHCMDILVCAIVLVISFVCHGECATFYGLFGKNPSEIYWEEKNEQRLRNFVEIKIEKLWHGACCVLFKLTKCHEHHATTTHPSITAYHMKNHCSLYSIFMLKIRSIFGVNASNSKTYGVAIGMTIAWQCICMYMPLMQASHTTWY